MASNVHINVRINVRRENVRINIGSDKYAFNVLQMNFIPDAYKPPAGSFGAKET